MMGPVQTSGAWRVRCHSRAAIISALVGGRAWVVGSTSEARAHRNNWRRHLLPPRRPVRPADRSIADGVVIAFVSAANAPTAGAPLSATGTPTTMGGTTVLGPSVYQPAGGQTATLIIDAYSNNGIGFLVTAWSGGVWRPVAQVNSSSFGAVYTNLNFLDKAITAAPVLHQARRARSSRLSLPPPLHDGGGDLPSAGRMGGAVVHARLPSLASCPPTAGCSKCCPRTALPPVSAFSQIDYYGGLMTWRIGGYLAFPGAANMNISVPSSFRVLFTGATGSACRQTER